MLPSKRSLRLCVYNYKGGAAKTTIVVNTAAALAHPDHGNQKVLLIDLDPQCNSTQFYHDDNETLGGGRTVCHERLRRRRGPRPLTAFGWDGAGAHLRRLAPELRCGGDGRALRVEPG